MIYKELDALNSVAADATAIHFAQEMMAAHLTRAFASSGDVDVLSGLRVKAGNVTAQVDHLVLHPYGLMVVDCQSVLGGLQVCEDGQWLSWRNSHVSEMRSPVHRVFAQASAFKQFLEMKVKQRGFFSKMEMAVLVAVPDKSAIEWPPSGALSIVCNTAQVPARILQRVQDCALRFGGRGIFHAEHRDRLAEFLCAAHQPDP